MYFRAFLALLLTVAFGSYAFAENLSPASPDANTSVNDQQSAAAPHAASTKININIANAKELMKVKGINAARARAIVAYRKKHGEFKAVDELGNVRGFNKMKSARLQEIQSQVTVE